MNGGGSAPSCCAFTHRVAFEEGSAQREGILTVPFRKSLLCVLRCLGGYTPKRRLELECPEPGYCCCCKSLQSCLTLCDAIDSSPPGSPPLGFSRQEHWSVPCSALKGETVPDSLPATPKSPPTRRVPPRGQYSCRENYMDRGAWWITVQGITKS